MFKIDPDVTVDELLATYARGETDTVINALSADHAGLTALFLLEGIRRKKLDRAECNRIANALVDDRMAICQANDAPLDLTKGDKANFETLRTACLNNDLAIVAARRKCDNASVALVCAMGFENGVYIPSPLAVMIEGNPFEDFRDPLARRPDPS